MSPPQPVLAVGAVVLEDGRLLLVRRGTEPGAGLWSLPGGRVEPGESLENAVSREVMEETGLAVEVGSLVGFVERRSAAHHFVILDFAATLTGPGRELRAGDDASSARWVSTTTLQELPLVEGLYDFLAKHGVI